MKIVLSDFITWQTCIILLLISLFLFWIFYGGKDLEFVGLKPLKIGVDSNKYIKNFCYSKENDSKEEQKEEIQEKDDQSIKEEEDDNNEEIPKSPNTLKNLALGEHVCYANGKLSRGEALCKQIIEEIYKVPFYCVRPNFLKNPETGRNLELDLYNDSLKLAIEYNAEQHYVFPNSFHKTHEEFINQVRRDQFKVEMCDKNGVYLITVPYNIPLNYDEMKKYIQYYLPEDLS